MGFGILRLVGVTIIAVIATAVNAQSSCSDGFVHHNNDCYTVIFINATWVQAREFCHAIGARLASIESHDEQRFITGHIDIINMGGFARPNIYWFGGTDLNEISHFRWSHNQASITYTHWSPHEPNNYFGRERCMEIYNDHSWNDEDCSEKKNFICETSATN